MNQKTARLIRKASGAKMLKDVKRWYRGLPWPKREKAKDQMRAQVGKSLVKGAKRG